MFRPSVRDILIGFKVSEGGREGGEGGKEGRGKTWYTIQGGRVGKERKNTVFRDEGREGIEKTWQAGPSEHNQWYGLATSQTNYRTNLMG